MNVTKCSLAAAGFMLALAGCTSAVLQGDQPTVKIYVLNATIDLPDAVVPTNAVLLVSQPKTQPGFETRGMVYSREPLTLEVYTKSEWADTPANMLAPLVVNALERAGGFKAVVSAPAQTAADLRLDLDIVSFQQEFFSQPSQLRISLRAKLFDAQSRRVMSTKLFEALQPAPSEDAKGGVQAANQALHTILEDLTTFVTSQARTPAS